MLTHSYVPGDMLLSALVPIPKSKKKSPNDSNNYRSIALSSILAKVMDNIILMKHGHLLHTSDLQFGFKPNHSTIQCTFVMQEVVDYYMRRGSPCHAILLDASKAFDRVEYVKLFRLLVKRKLCPLTIKLLLCMYTNQSLFVKWNGTKSARFECSNGIKQGGVISPVLFCIYMDELLVRLEKTGVGCYMGHYFMGALCYADDLTILAPSVSSAQKLLTECEKYANEFNVKFNSSKSVLVPFNVPDGQIIKLKLNGLDILHNDNAIHLGSHIGKDGNRNNICKAVQHLIYRTNMLMSNYGFCSYKVRVRLFDTFCMSLYGSPLWKISSKYINELIVTWKKCVRKVLKIDKKSRSRYLPHLIDKPDIKCQLLLRFAKFWLRCKCSSNSRVKIAAQNAMRSQSIVAENVRQVSFYLNDDISDICDVFNSQNDVKCRFHAVWVKKLLCEDQITASIIKELIACREGNLCLHYTRNDVNTVLVYLCTS